MYDKTRANLIKNLRKESNRGHFFDVLIFCCCYFDHRIVSSHTENLFNLISLLKKNVDCLLLPLIFHHGPALSFWIYDFLLFLLPFVFRFFCLHFFHFRIRTSIHFEFMLVFSIVFMLCTFLTRRELWSSEHDTLWYRMTATYTDCSRQ